MSQFPEDSFLIVRLQAVPFDTEWETSSVITPTVFCEVNLPFPGQGWNHGRCLRGSQCLSSKELYRDAGKEESCHVQL